MYLKQTCTHVLACTLNVLFIIKKQFVMRSGGLLCLETQLNGRDEISAREYGRAIGLNVSTVCPLLSVKNIIILFFC